MAPSLASGGFHWAKQLWKSRREGGRAEQRRKRRRHTAAGLRPETLEPRALLAVTAGLTGAELLIDLGEANDTAILQVEGGSYAIREGAQTVGSFSLAAVNSIRVTGDAAKPGQMLFIKPGGVVTDSLTVNAGVEATVVNAPIVTSGAVSIESATVTLAENVSSSGSQFYAGTVRLSNDVVLDAGAGQIRFGSQIRSTVGPRATLLEDLGAPNRLAVAPGGGVLYASDAISNYVYFIDLAAQQLDTVDLGKSMGHVALSPDGRRLYVANPLDGTVSVVDTVSRSAVATIAVSGTPEGMTFSPDGQTLYVANYSENSVAVINAATNRVTRTIAVAGSPTAVAAGADGRLWVASELLNRVSVVDAATAAIVAEIPVGRGPADVVLSPDGSRAYVANNFDGTVSAIDTATTAVLATIGVGSGPVELAATPDGRMVYVVNGFSDSVSVIDTASLTVATTTSVGSLPVGLALSADGRTAYVANLNSISELGNDARSLTVRTTGTAIFGGLASEVDPLRQLTIQAGQQIGPPTSLVPFESRGTVTLARDQRGYLWANGRLLTANGVPLNFDSLVAGGWTPVAADVDGGRNTLVLRHTSGHLTFLRFDAGWRQASGDGWIAPETTAFYANELAFDADLGGDGLITIEAAGDITLAYNAVSGNLQAAGRQLVFNGSPLNYRTLSAGGWRAMAAEADRGVNTVVLVHASGNLHYWRMDADWKQVSGDGWVAPGSSEFFAAEVTFGVDLNGDGGVTIETAGDVIFAYDGDGNLAVNGTVVTYQGGPMNYHRMRAAGWRAMAADVAADGRNTIVLKHATGYLHYWRLDATWTQTGGDGWVPLFSRPFFAAEAAFGADLDGDGTRTIDAVGSTILTYDRVGLLRVHAVSGSTIDVAGSFVMFNGSPANYHGATAAGWAVKAAEFYAGRNTIPLVHSSGYVHFWRFDASWVQQSSDGWVDADSPAALPIETAFGIDLNGNNRIGA